jgi:hypothetical protein
LRKAVVVTFLLLVLAPLPRVLPFTASLPSGVPDLHGWEKVAGAADLVEPPLRVEYEFYVNPVRPGLYELIRYRVTLPLGTRLAANYPALEKVQWQRGARDLRRFECRPAAARSAPCRWRELPPGSEAYEREVSVIVWLYGLHNRMTHQRLAD